MDKLYRVMGIFSLEVEGEDFREAREKVHRILRVDEIEHNIINVEEVSSDERKCSRVQM
ncbi:hypothetical protein [Calorimonas adulescens]|uniref:hypothetical protein n=1 Tax=Calorimonas adulescens TaxID=2606906 RepID=UPI001396A8BB|nr:hypothetical protein [Calorimonas adulescens]